MSGPIVLNMAGDTRLASCDPKGQGHADIFGYIILWLLQMTLDKLCVLLDIILFKIKIP